MTHDATPAGAAAGGPHPEVSEIADLAEDLLSPERSAVLLAHLDRCDPCGDLLASLDEVRGLLGAFPDPGPMPADVVARLDASLSAEAARPSSTPTPAPSASPDVSRETPPPSSATDVSRETWPTFIPPGPAGDVSRETRSPRRPPHRAPRRWPRRLLSTAATAAILVGAGFGLHAFHTSESGADASNAKGTARQPTLRERVRVLLDSASSDSASSVGSPHSARPGVTRKGRGGDRTSSPSRSAGLPGTTSLPSCVRAALHRSDPPIAAAKEYDEGRWVYLVVLAHPGNAQKVDAFVVAASCASASPGVRGTVLGRHTYTR
jgi:hypothetical protein